VSQATTIWYQAVVSLSFLLDLTVTSVESLIAMLNLSWSSAPILTIASSIWGEVYPVAQGTVSAPIDVFLNQQLNVHVVLDPEPPGVLVNLVFAIIIS